MIQENDKLNSIRSELIDQLILMRLVTVIILMYNVSMFGYIIYGAYNLNWELGQFGWAYLSFFFLIPCTGYFFLVANKKIGWFISTSFFSFLMLASGISLVQGLFRNWNNAIQNTGDDMRLLYFIFGALVSAFLLTEKIQIRFGVRKKPIAVVTVISTILLLFLIAWETEMFQL